MAIKIEKRKTKCVILSRKPRAKEDDKFKTAIIGLFDKNNAHKTGETPKEVLEYSNIEKIRLKNVNVSYYLEGNDIVINDLKGIKLDIDEKKRKIVLRADQVQVEERE